MMKIVIDIPEEIYNNFMNDWVNSPDILHAVRHGTPLPKGHGTLVDRSEVIKSLFDYHKGKKTLGQCIEDFQTIIEADWEDEE